MASKNDKGDKRGPSYSQLSEGRGGLSRSCIRMRGRFSRTARSRSCRSRWMKKCARRAPRI